MKIDVLSLFPHMFDNILEESIIKRAIEKKIVEINIIDFREYSTLNNKQVDDTPYGGGAGMVLMCEPIIRALDDIKTDKSHVVLLTPQAGIYKQNKAQELINYQHLILICGHYEGFDERILNFVDEQISIGDYILTGGEIPAMVIIDSCTRLLDGTINSKSLDEESFATNLLDYPTYTKPREFRGYKVPDVLLSGDHKKIAEYRKQMQLQKTKQQRPDLLNQ